MFELAGLSTFLDIFQKAFGLIEKRKDQKRQLFKEIIDPVYTEMSVVVADYYAFFRTFRDELSQSEMRHWATVLEETKKKREEIVLARNKVLGLTYPFVREREDKLGFPLFISTPKDNKSKEDVLLYRFAKGINDFFYASDDLGVSEASSLFLEIERIASQQEQADFKPDGIRQIEKVLERLENKWRMISSAYGELRVFCLR